MRLTSLALLLFLATSGSLAQNADLGGTWTAEIRADRVSLQVRTSIGNRDGSNRPSTNGQSFLPADFTGFPPGGESLSTGNVRFELRREAGSFSFDGAFRRGQGAGLFTFTPRPEYAGELKTLGYAVDLPLWRQFQLAFHDVGPRYIRALRSEGYNSLAFEEIERGRNHGVTLDYIRTLKDRGYQGLDWDELIRTRDHGVTASFIEDLRDLGFRDLPLQQIVRTRDHGVNADFIREMRAEKIDSSSLEDFIRLRDHGVTPEYVADMRELGFGNLSLNELVRLRDHGVTPGFVNHARSRGYKDATLEELVRLKDRGF